MGTKELVTVLLSSTVIATLITTLFNVLTNKRKDKIENITKERKKWREELREIAAEITKASDVNEFELAITKLKVRINAYGVSDNSIFSDSQLWMQFHHYENYVKPLTEYSNNKTLDSFKSLFVNQISCLLKYDWERTKSEIKGNMQNKFVSGALIISFLFYSLRYFLTNGYTNETIVEFVTFSFAFSIFSIYALLVIGWADKWVSRVQWDCYLILSIIGFVCIVFMFLGMLPNLVSNESIDLFILFLPVLVLLYGSEIKILAYRRNTSRLIMSITILSGATEIDRKYKVFFNKKPYINIATNREITFKE